jgi:hypothetical protein
MCHVRPSEEQQLIINYSCLLPVKIFITRTYKYCYQNYCEHQRYVTVLLYELLGAWS